MRNRIRVVAALRDAGALAYSELRERSGVPAGSFDRTLTALVRDGKVLKDSDGYRLDGDGSTTNWRKPARRAGFSCIASAARERTRDLTRQEGGRWRTSTGGPSRLNIGGVGSPPPAPENAKCA